MKDLLKRMVVGTFFEPLARKLYLLLTRKSMVHDKNRLYDMQTYEVMKRVLKKDSNCVDVGCHVGSILKEILIAGRPMWFEIVSYVRLA